MKSTAFTMLLGLMVWASGCQTNDAGNPSSANDSPARAIRPIKLTPGLGPIQMTVTTANPEAQKYFDQGLAYIYAFNHEAAVRSFERAAELDATLAMAMWGKALALGPNINMPEIDGETRQAALAAARKAEALATRVTPHERAYITAINRRYSADARSDPKQLNKAYAAAMKEVTRQYPQDLHAATLYAEALMDLRPWQYWTKDGKPAEGTEEIVQVLEWVLARDANHTGANHYYIHAVEASNQPERALPSAQRLPRLAPGAGHLVHMPAHIYIRVGDYARAIDANAQAAKVDEEYMSCCGVAGLYPALYYSHNLHFLAVCAAMAGRSREASEAMTKLASHVDPLAEKLPPADGFGAFPLLIAARQAQWGTIARWPKPADSRVLTLAAWNFARGMADASTGKLAPALDYQTRFLQLVKTMPSVALGNNTSTQIFAVGRHVLAARIAVARNDLQTARSELERAVALQDDMAYDEPPPWPWPVRESLGALLLKLNDPAEAEKVFRADLVKNPNNPRSLFGLAEALKARRNFAEEKQTRDRFEAAWKSADMKLRLEEF